MNEHPIPARPVYVRNHNNRKNWIAQVSTDMNLSEEEFIRIYGVMVRYMILSVFQRQYEDHSAFGELFFVMLTELEVITFNHSMMILVEAIFQTVKSVFLITDEQLEEFAAEFYSRLPEYMQKSLSYTQSSGSEAFCHG